MKEHGFYFTKAIGVALSYDKDIRLYDSTLLLSTYYK